MKLSALFSMLLCAFFCGSSVSAFQVATPKISSSSTTALNVFGNKKSAAVKAAEEAEAAQYWQGEWVCKDCGYIYNRVS